MNVTTAHQDLCFGSFRLDIANQCLWRGRQRLTLRPKAFTLLQTLLERAGQLVTRQELLDAVWPDTCVSDDVLRFSIREVRKMLRDTPRSSRFIETVHRRGYRFIAPLRQAPARQDRQAIATPQQIEPRTESSRTAEEIRIQSTTTPESMRGETIAHLTNGIALLATLPESRERIQQELMLQLALGAPLIAAKGHGASEVTQTYARARELCRQLGETPQLFPVLWGLAVNATVRGELRLGHEVSERLVHTAAQLHDLSCLVEAKILHGAVSLWLGNLEPGKMYLEEGLTLMEEKAPSVHTFLYGHNPEVVCRVVLSKALWLLGRPDQALNQGRTALSQAQAATHPYSVVFALNWLAMLHGLLREPQAARDHADAAIAQSHAQGFAHLEAVAKVLRGSALLALGDVQEGIAQMQQGLTACRAVGAVLMQPYLLAQLAAAHTSSGQTKQGQQLLHEAFLAVRATDEHWYEAALYIQRGELLLA